MVLLQIHQGNTSDPPRDLDCRSGRTPSAATGIFFGCGQRLCISRLRLAADPPNSLKAVGSILRAVRGTIGGALAFHLWSPCNTTGFLVWVVFLLYSGICWIIVQVFELWNLKWRNTKIHMFRRHVPPSPPSFSGHSGGGGHSGVHWSNTVFLSRNCTGNTP